MHEKKMRIVGLAFLVVFLGTLAGCSTLSRKSGAKSKPFSIMPEKKAPQPAYMDFNDVLIPGELKRVPGKSFYVASPGYAAGIMALQGRVDLPSLLQFFQNNMAKDNWQQISYVKSPRIMMLYRKENRWCVISITDKGGFNINNVYVEIWVAPSVRTVESGLLK